MLPVMSGSVDVVITTHQGWEFTKRCLEHLREQNRRAHGHRLGQRFDRRNTREHPHALPARGADRARRLIQGYAAATNHGVAAGSADVILLLNNDAFCRPDFLEHLVAAFDNDERVGAVAPLTMRSDERTIDSVGSTLDVTLAPFIRLTGKPSEEAASGRPLLVSPGGGADAYRRSAWSEAGGLDERLSFYGADIDLALRLRSLGWTTVAAPGAVAVHLRSATSGHRSRRARQSGGWARGLPPSALEHPEKPRRRTRRSSRSRSWRWQTWRSRGTRSRFDRGSAAGGLPVDCRA